MKPVSPLRVTVTPEVKDNIDFLYQRLRSWSEVAEASGKRDIRQLSKGDVVDMAVGMFYTAYRQVPVEVGAKEAFILEHYNHLLDRMRREESRRAAEGQ